MENDVQVGEPLASEGTMVSTTGARLISMSDGLTHAGHGLSLAEKRIIALAISKLDSKSNRSLFAAPTTRVKASELSEAFGVNKANSYRQLESAAKMLYKRTITFYEPSFSRKTGKKSLEDTRVEMRWVGEVRYQRGEGWVDLVWWPKLVPHLCGLERKFTSYQLSQASALRSVYSWKLLELLQRFTNSTGRGWATYTIEDFVESMDATEAQRKDFSKIRTKIIEPAIKELENKDGWSIEWEAQKQGRKVVSLRFKYSRNPQMSLI